MKIFHDAMLSGVPVLPRAEVYPYDGMRVDHLFLSAVIRNQNDIDQLIQFLQVHQFCFADPYYCQKDKLTQEEAERRIERDKRYALTCRSGKCRPLQKVAYYCEECKAWHTSTMTPRNPRLK